MSDTIYRVEWKDRRSGPRWVNFQTAAEAEAYVLGLNMGHDHRLLPPVTYTRIEPGHPGEVVVVGGAITALESPTTWSHGDPLDLRPPDYPFRSVLDEIAELHDRKSRDYGTSDDPYANVAASADFGIPGWAGALVRANDKVRRLQSAVRQVVAGGDATMTNEGVEDSLLDLAAYAVIALVLWRREEDQR